MSLNAGQLTRQIYSGLMQWTDGACQESWMFAGTTFSEMPTSVALATSHHFHPSWMRMQRTGGDHRGGSAQF